MKINFILLILTCIMSNAQVGINTVTTKATLDVKKQEALTYPDWVLYRQEFLVIR